MYLPPRPQAASKSGGYQRTVERLLEWLDGCLSEQKHRTTPVVLMDANDGIGLELRAGRYHPVYCQCIAAAGERREHVAGKRLREIMEKHHMRATSAELGGATWCGVTGSSLIDYVWAPAALPLRCSGPLRKLAAELQLIDTRQLRDHAPLGLEFDYVQLAGQQPAPGEKEAWNADALMENVRGGTGRVDFLAALEDKVKAEETQWAPLQQLHFPDLLDDYLNKVSG